MQMTRGSFPGHVTAPPRLLPGCGAGVLLPARVLGEASDLLLPLDAVLLPPLVLLLLLLLPGLS